MAVPPGRFRRAGLGRRWLVGLLSLWLGACTLASPPVVPRLETPRPVVLTQPEDGALLYKDMCASCHGVDGKGHGPAAAALKVPPTDLTILSVRHGGSFPRDYVASVLSGAKPVVAHGTGEMPVWSQRIEPRHTGASVGTALYMRRRLEAITDYLESIQRQPDVVEPARAGDRG